MLEELRVENLLLIERAELRLAEGLNVLTGETGAGKTVLAHALDLLLGGKPRSGIVRPGAQEAYVEGVFSLPDELRETLGDRLPDDAEDVVLARRVSAEGRTRAYLGGRSATAADLRDVGGALLSFYGQHEHRKLTLASAQLEILDGFCGDGQAARRASFAAAYVHERELRGRLEELKARAGARDRELDLLEWELQEIEGADPSEDEEASLSAERERLRHLGALLAAAAGGLEAIAGESGEGAATALAGASRALEGVRGVDAELDALADRVTALAVEADDVATGLRALRRGRGVDARAARRGRGAPRAAGPAEAQARRHDGRGARPRRGVPPPARRAGRRRGGAGGRGARARGGARGARHATPRRSPPPAARPRARWPRRCASGWRAWPWTARPSRPRSARVTATGPAAATRWSS